MIEYLRSKVAEYSGILRWLARELEDLADVVPEGAGLIGHLRDRLAIAEEQHTRLETLVKVGSSMLFRRALSIIHSIDHITRLIGLYYIPALRKHSSHEQFMRQLFRTVASRLGLYWLQDVVVRLDGPPATIPIPEFPVILAPPRWVESFADMPALYHEMGHNVFQKFPGIGQRLSQLVGEFFGNLRLQAGPMGPQQLRERDQSIAAAQYYWGETRLNELFSDVFAAFCCGPAYYVFIVDAALKWAYDPFLIDPQDVHPPFAARVRSSYQALSEVGRLRKVSRLAHSMWESHSCLFQVNNEYRLACHDALLGSFVDFSVRLIQELLPGSKPCDGPEDTHLLELAGTGGSLEEWLNVAATVLLLRPDDYTKWEREVFSQPDGWLLGA